MYLIDRNIIFESLKINLINCLLKGEERNDQSNLLVWHQKDPDFNFRLKIDHHLFQPRPRVRWLQKVQI